MTELSYSPRPKNKNARYLCAALFGSAILFACLYMLIESYKSIVAAIVCAFLFAAIFIYSAYVATVYYYEVVYENGARDFVIRKMFGKRQVTLCRVELSSVCDVRLLSYRERKSYRRTEGVSVYAYHPTLMPDALCLVSVRSDSECADIFIEADEAFVSAIREMNR